MKTLDKITSAVAAWTSKYAAARTAASSAVAELQRVDRELRAEDDTIAADHRALASALPPKAEVIAAAETRIDADAAAWAREHGTRLVAAAGGRLHVSPAGEVLGIVPGDLFAAFGALSGQLDPVAALAALMPLEFKRRVRAIIEATDYTPGPPLAQRPAMIAELRNRRTELEDQHRRLVDEAAAAGITLADLPANVGRRLAEAREAEQIARHNSLNEGAIRRGVIQPAETIEQAR